MTDQERDRLIAAATSDLHGCILEIERLKGELSRALGLLDAAHVYLDSLGVDRCDGASVHDRMARYVGTAETQLADLQDAICACRFEDGTPTNQCAYHKAAEARATAAEQERDDVKGALLWRGRQCAVSITGCVEDGVELRIDQAWLAIDHCLYLGKQAHDRLAAAEQREAEKDKRIAALTERRFPIQGGPSIPWSVIAPYAQQAVKNHSQDLETLARRGGLSPCEAMAVLDNRPWHHFTDAEDAAALVRLRALASPSTPSGEPT